VIREQRSLLQHRFSLRRAVCVASRNEIMHGFVLKCKSSSKKNEKRRLCCCPRPQAARPLAQASDAPLYILGVLQGRLTAPSHYSLYISKHPANRESLLSTRAPQEDILCPVEAPVIAPLKTVAVQYGHETEDGGRLEQA